MKNKKLPPIGEALFRQLKAEHAKRPADSGLSIHIEFHTQESVDELYKSINATLATIMSPSKWSGKE